MIAAQAKKTQNNKQGIQKEEKFFKKKKFSLYTKISAQDTKLGQKLSLRVDLPPAIEA